MTTLATLRPELENPMACGNDVISMDDYIIDTATPEDMADYVYDMSKTDAVINDWLYGADLNVSQADMVFEAMKEKTRNRICAKWVEAHDADGFVSWKRRVSYE